jgi:hypothetical protein
VIKVSGVPFSPCAKKELKSKGVLRDAFTGGGEYRLLEGAKASPAFSGGSSVKVYEEKYVRIVTAVA